MPSKARKLHQTLEENQRPKRLAADCLQRPAMQTSAPPATSSSIVWT